MTNSEIIWLSRRMPKAEIVAVCEKAGCVIYDWPGVPLDRLIAARVAMIELGLIEKGALKLLDRSVGLRGRG
jgi:hypothetical protein